MEAIFRAIGHSSRRLLLDRLFERDGQTLGALAAHVTMTRFGVMKHLRILEAAGLVATRKVGREKLHYLNPIPLRLIHDRWISKYSEPWVRGLGILEADLEAITMASPKHVYEVYIRTTPEKLWEAITSPEFTRRYFYQCAVESDWKAGSAIRHRMPDGSLALDGKILEVVPTKKLVTTFAMVHDPEASKDRPSRVSWEIQKLGPACKLTVVHDDFDGETKTFREVLSGWNPVLSGLKTLLETGDPLVIERSGT